MLFHYARIKTYKEISERIKNIIKECPDSKEFFEKNQGIIIKVNPKIKNIRQGTVSQQEEIGILCEDGSFINIEIIDIDESPISLEITK